MEFIRTRAFHKCGLPDIYISDGVEKLYDECFYDCESLSRVRFGAFSSLNLIGNEAFHKTGVREIHFANGVMKRFLQAPCLAIGGLLRHDQVGNEIT